MYKMGKLWICLQGEVLFVAWKAQRCRSKHLHVLPCLRSELPWVHIQLPWAHAELRRVSPGLSWVHTELPWVSSVWSKMYIWTNSIYWHSIYSRCTSSSPCLPCDCFAAHTAKCRKQSTSMTLLALTMLQGHGFTSTQSWSFWKCSPDRPPRYVRTSTVSEAALGPHTSHAWLPWSQPMPAISTQWLKSFFHVSG